MCPSHSLSFLGNPQLYPKLSATIIYLATHLVHTHQQESIPVGYVPTGKIASTPGQGYPGYLPPHTQHPSILNSLLPRG